MGITKGTDKKEMLILHDPFFGTHMITIQSRDDEGNITTLAKNTDYTGILSLLGDRVGILCVQEASDFSSPNNIENVEHARYYYISNELEIIPLSELKTQSHNDFEVYKNCTKEPLTPKKKIAMLNYINENQVMNMSKFSPFNYFTAYKFDANGKTRHIAISFFTPDLMKPNNKDIYLAIYQ